MQRVSREHEYLDDCMLGETREPCDQGRTKGCSKSLHRIVATISEKGEVHVEEEYAGGAQIYIPGRCQRWASTRLEKLMITDRTSEL